MTRTASVVVVMVMAVTAWAWAMVPSRAIGGVTSVWDVPGSPYSPGDRVVALTFDDGPNPTYTRQILEVLDRYQAPGSFFVVGREAVNSPDLLQAEAAGGHGVANHTWDHVDLTRIPASAYRHQVDDTTDVITANTGWRTPCARPPYGRINDTVTARLAERGLSPVGWSVDPSDYRRPGARAIADRVLSSVRAGSIVLLHDGGGDRSQTVAALPSIIQGIRNRGFELVSLCRPPPPPPPRRLVNGQWFLHTTASSGPADDSFTFGDPGDLPVTGDWDGDGVDTPGVVRGNTFYLRNSNTSGPADNVFTYGQPGDHVIVGDWNGDAVDTIGVVRGNTFFIRNSNTSGPADNVFTYGDPGDQVVVGRWQLGALADTIGVVRGNTFYLRNSNTSGPADNVFTYGDPGDHVIVADWNGDGVDTPGVIRGNTFFIRNSNTNGPADNVFTYGDPQDVFPLTGRWATNIGLPAEGPGVAR